MTEIVDIKTADVDTLRKLLEAELRGAALWEKEVEVLNQEVAVQRAQALRYAHDAAVEEHRRIKAEGLVAKAQAELEMMRKARQPLTEEEIVDIDRNTHFHELPDWPVRFARAIEHRHDII